MLNLYNVFPFFYRVFDDVVPSLKLWSNSNKIISTYSSGPTEVQKLAYKKVNDGELLKVRYFLHLILIRT